MADDQGRLVAFALTPGNIADISMVILSLEGIAPPKRLIADKAYDADRFRNWLKVRNIKAVIPSKAIRNRPYPFDRIAYRRRNVVERMFGKPENWRRIANRYDRLARNYLAALAIVSIVIAWI
ncbi:transposase [Rhodobium gokarnense]|uniref:Transposase n=1 Tax=Rhodobium gokarnense TaxID=364296 RepID=A0ABT3HEP8_9HYPH|nr:transposase [Rhodobium gokarnense]